MDPKAFASHFQHAQNMYAASNMDNQLRVPPDGAALANHLVFRSLFEGGGEKFMHHLHQQQQQQQQQYQHHHQQQQQQYRNDAMMMMAPVSSHGNARGGHHLQQEDDDDQPQNLHKSNPLPVEEPTYTCVENGCNKTFSNKRSFTMHFNSHRRQQNPSARNSNPSPPTHQCRECEKCYRSQGGLYWHEQTVHKKRVFNCSQCSKVYKSYPGFYLHCKSHDGSSFECHVCLKSYSQKATLKTHLRTHHLGDNNNSDRDAG